MPRIPDSFLPTVGRVFLGLGVLGSGVEQLITRHFVRLIPIGPEAHSVFVVSPQFVGTVLIVLGGMLVLGRCVRCAATMLVGLLLLAFFCLHVPLILAAPQHGYVWTNPCKVLALTAGALLLATTGGVPSAAAPWIRMITCAVVGGFLVLCGAQHVAYAEFVDTLVPKWLPSPRLWTDLTAAALIAGGVGVSIPRTRRLAGLLAGSMIFLWVLSLHLPRAIMETDHANEVAGIFEALALSGVAFLVAATAGPGSRQAERSSPPK